MRALQMIVVGLALAIAGCANDDPTLVEGGPTRSQALQAVLGNMAIVPPGADTSNTSLQASDCTKVAGNMVQCTIKLYSATRGWSQPTTGHFMPSGGNTWMFSF